MGKGEKKDMEGRGKEEKRKKEDRRRNRWIGGRGKEVGNKSVEKKGRGKKMKGG